MGLFGGGGSLIVVKGMLEDSGNLSGCGKERGFGCLRYTYSGDGEGMGVGVGV